MKIKVGDKVSIIAGKDKGKEGIVSKTLKKQNKVVVEGINMAKKHMKPNAFNEVGSIIDVEMPIHVSNVKLIDAKASKTVKAAPKKEAPKKETAKKSTKKTTKKEVGEKNE